MDFRPEVKAWGGRGEVRCAKILELRKKVRGPAQDTDASLEEAKPVMDDSGNIGPPVGVTAPEQEEHIKKEEGEQGEGEPEAKKARTGVHMTLEEYEAALDADDAFDSIDLDFPDTPPDPFKKEPNT